MASIHESLKALGPVSYSDVPQDEAGRAHYLKEHLSAGRLLVESVPQPAATAPSSGNRSRAVSSASCASGMSASAARSETPAEHEILQKDWGKPVKLSDKDNPLGICVFKLSGKDGRGAWFARRSVHEGLSYDKWKKGLEEEFEQSLHVEGGPGAGKIRGLGAEKRPESHLVAEVGTMDVWHVSAQFPGPSAPRDFVSMVMTSDKVFEEEDHPKHFMIISKPCEHDDCPPKDGLVRGQYESVEFIREIPRSRKAGSTIDPDSTSLGEGDVQASTSKSNEARERTIAFAEPDSNAATKSDNSNTEEAELNPVEWIMITRSDPGGSVPRFLVERGTPGGIVSDASKFLDWACKTEFSTETTLPAVTPGAAAEESSTSEEPGHSTLETESEAQPPQQTTTSNTPAPISEEPSLLSKATDAISLLLPNPNPSTSTADPHALSRRLSTSSSTSSTDSFASAETDLDVDSSLHTLSSKSATTPSSHTLSAQEKELLRLANRKAELETKLHRTRETAFSDPTNPTEKETQQVAKIQAKHDSEISKAEDRYRKAVRSIEVHRQKDEEKARQQAETAARKEEEKKVKAERKAREVQEREMKKQDDARHKAEIDKFREEVKGLVKERDALKEHVRVLNGENSKLITLVSKLDGGERLLAELKVGNGGSR